MTEETRIGFNEAPAFLPGNSQQKQARQIQPPNASMRPRHFYRGIEALFYTFYRRDCDASMRPRHFYRGIDRIMTQYILGGGHASMRPRHFYRGIASMPMITMPRPPSFNEAPAFLPGNRAYALVNNTVGLGRLQ